MWRNTNRKPDYSIKCNVTFGPIHSPITVYLKETELCDGVVHCPNSEDEAFEMCKQREAFPPSATVECESKWAGTNVTILATPCNSEEECKSGEDEKNCGGSKIIYVVLGSLLFGSICVWSAVLHFSEVQKSVIEVDIKNCNDEELQVLVVNSQESHQRKQACQVLFEHKMEEYREQARALNALQVHMLQNTF